MKRDMESANYVPDKEAVVTVGVFDGVHRGHRYLFSRLLEERDRLGCLAGVVTFNNHPSTVVAPGLEPLYLTSVDSRINRIREVGVDFVAPIDFNRELSILQADQFVVLLQERFCMKGMVVGPDFAMGHHREGDIQILSALGRDMGFSLTVADPLKDEAGRPITSTSVREALFAGDVNRVSSLMGRHFELDGKVIMGAGRGKLLGFPTANVDLQEELACPGDGIYATWVYVGQCRYMAATSVGVRPTFSGEKHAIEAFILDFDDDIYGMEIRLEFVQWLRHQISFDTIHALQSQIKEDVFKTRAVLEACHLS